MLREQAQIRLAEIRHCSAANAALAAESHRVPGAGCGKCRTRGPPIGRWPSPDRGPSPVRRTPHQRAQAGQQVAVAGTVAPEWPGGPATLMAGDESGRVLPDEPAALGDVSEDAGRNLPDQTTSPGLTADAAATFVADEGGAPGKVRDAAATNVADAENGPEKAGDAAGANATGASRIVSGASSSPVANAPGETTSPGLAADVTDPFGSVTSCTRGVACCW